MSEPLTFLFTAFVSIFVIVDAIGNAPLFLTITPHHSPSERNRIATRASVSVFIILTTFALLGNRIFAFFGITLDAFRIAGGLILLKIALDMLEAKTIRTRHTPEEDRESLERQDIAIIPLAMPMLSGPGAISTVIVLTGQAKNIQWMAMLEAAILFNALFVLFVLRSSVQIVSFLKETGLRLLTRILGIVLASIAVQFIVTGVQNIFLLHPP
jgi:multiple antibiotic resistance protein